MAMNPSERVYSSDNFWAHLKRANTKKKRNYWVMVEKGLGYLRAEAAEQLQ